MKGLILKDFLLMQKYTVLLILYFLISGLLCVMPFAAEEWEPLYDPVICALSIYLTATLYSVFVITTFEHDDASCWMKQALTIVSRRKYLAAKYVFHVLIGISGVAISTAILLGLAVWYEAFEAIGITLLSGLAGLEIVLYMGAVLVPLLVRFGAEKCRLLWFAVFLPVAAVLFWCGTISFDEIVAIVLPLLVPLLLVPIAVIFGVMLPLGLRWVRKKEV